LKKIIFALLLFCIGATHTGRAQSKGPDTVQVGTYITSIHDINFKDKEYTLTMWLWLKYTNKDFDFLHNLEIPQAKTVTTAFSTVDSSDNKIFMMMKLQCVMKDSWAIDNFPFDRQKLRFSIENSQFDSKALVFKADNNGKHFDPKFTLRGWRIDSLDITTGVKAYETAFGDASLKKPHTEYSNYKIRLQIDRNAMGLFWKMFLGMYVAFLIAYMCFFIHADSIDSRFGLSVGALFAVIGNKYIIDSSLPESTTFTLVDTLHGITLLFILIIIISTAYSLKLIKKDKVARAEKYDRWCGNFLLASYLLLNAYFIFMATRVGAA
jgi:hypothetical protein